MLICFLPPLEILSPTYSILTNRRQVKAYVSKKSTEPVSRS